MGRLPSLLCQSRRPIMSLASFHPRDDSIASAKADAAADLQWGNAVGDIQCQFPVELAVLAIIARLEPSTHESIVDSFIDCCGLWDAAAMATVDDDGQTADALDIERAIAESAPTPEKALALLAKRLGFKVERIAQ